MITEVKTDNRWPCCPFMSGQPVPVAPPPGHVLQPNQLAVAPLAVPCAEKLCSLYDRMKERCCLAEVMDLSHDLAALHDRVAGLSEISAKIHELSEVLAPPRHGPSPLMRIAESVETLVKLEKTTVSLKVDQRHR